MLLSLSFFPISLTERRRGWQKRRKAKHKSKIDQSGLTKFWVNLGKNLDNINIKLNTCAFKSTSWHLQLSPSKTEVIYLFNLLFKKKLKVWGIFSISLFIYCLEKKCAIHNCKYCSTFSCVNIILFITGELLGKPLRCYLNRYSLE